MQFFYMNAIFLYEFKCGNSIKKILVCVNYEIKQS